MLLVVAGALKVVDPTGTIGALRALGVSVDAPGIRVLAGAEVVLGVLALSVSSAVIAVGVALSYLLFGVVTIVAVTRNLPIDSCGCLGRLETPPGGRHLVVIAAAFVGAVAQVLDPDASLLERLTEDGVDGVLFALGACMLALVAIALFRAGRRPSTLR